MKKHSLLALSIASFSLVGSTGCTTTRDARITNPNAPGPAVGQAVGTAVGAVGSNVVGVVVGAGEGVASATKQTFTNERRVVRTWKEEKTADGRTIRVAVETEVDAEGRPIEQAK